MSGHDLVRRARRGLVTAVLLRAILYGIGAAASIAAGISLLHMHAAPAFLIAAATAAAAFCVWRDRNTFSLQKTALWMEEREPALQYRLVTAIDPRYDTALSTALAPAIHELSRTAHVRSAFARAIVLPSITAISLIALAFAARSASAGGDASVHAAADPDRSNRLLHVDVIVTPPAYATGNAAAPVSLRDPANITALAGSMIGITGNGDTAGLAAETDARVAFTKTGDRWSLNVALGARSALLRITDGMHQRTLVLEPLADEPPDVTLVTPASDTTRRDSAGSIALHARLSDDIGLANAWFEYVIASGAQEGEFRHREGRTETRRLQNAERAELTGTLSLSALQMRDGEHLLVRAVAVDNNTLSGPDTTFSETRTIRILVRGHEDSVSVNAGSAPADSSMVTLRLLMQRTEQLHSAKAGLRRDTVVTRANVIGDQVRVIANKTTQLQSDFTSLGLAPRSPLLDTAFNALTSAYQSLFVTETGEALGYMRTALAAFREFSYARRYYLRGRTRDVFVEVDRARMTGRDTGYVRQRSPRAGVEERRWLLLDRLNAIPMLLRSSPDSAIRAAAAIHADAISLGPAAAAATAQLLWDVQAHRDPGAALDRVRRVLSDPVTASEPPSYWRTLR